MLENDFYVDCKNRDESENVINILRENGAKIETHDDGYYPVQYLADNSANTWNISPEGKVYSYYEFLEKFNMNNLKNTVELAKEKLNLSERKLSEAIGQNSSYISKMLKNGTSTKNQEVIIEKLNNLMDGNPVTDADIIKDLSEKFSNAVDNCRYWRKENEKLEQDKESLKINIGVNGEKIDHLNGQLFQLQRHNTIAHVGYLLVIVALVLFIFLR